MSYLILNTVFNNAQFCASDNENKRPADKKVQECVEGHVEVIIFIKWHFKGTVVPEKVG